MGIERSSKHSLPLILGEDVETRRSVEVDLATLPHLLIAGGNDFSVYPYTVSLFKNLLETNPPDRLKLLFSDFALISSVLRGEVPADPLDSIRIGGVFRRVDWLLEEVESRYKRFRQDRIRHIADFNRFQMERGNENGILPHIVFVISELSPFVDRDDDEVEMKIVRLLQIGRTVGVHLILATQSPVVRSISGPLKACLSARLAFRVGNSNASRIVLDVAGAEKLKKDECLYQSSLVTDLIKLRTHTVLRDVESLRGRLGRSGFFEYFAEMTSEDPASHNFKNSIRYTGVDDDMLSFALEVIRVTRKATVSNLQRRLRLGYKRAKMLMDKLEAAGHVGPSRDSGSRKILFKID